MKMLKLAVTLVLAAAVGGFAAEPAKTPKVGDKAPAVEGKDQDGKMWKLADQAGKKAVLLYFYPKDDTPGCTKEACSFRDTFSQFKKRGITVLGVSPDSEKSHKKFETKYKLPFTLLADTDRSIAEAYGVWGEKTLYGRKFMGIERATFLIDAKGKIAHIWRKVRVPGHVEDVLKVVKAIDAK